MLQRDDMIQRLFFPQCRRLFGSVRALLRTVDQDFVLESGGPAVNNMREAQRQPINVKRGCTLGVITFKWLEWSDHVAQIVNISRGGVGIESAERMEPGFVWFKERVCGHRGGILIWSKQHGVTYRAGIKFVPLSPGEEHYVQERVGQSDHGRSAPDPDAIIATLVESIKRNVN